MRLFSIFSSLLGILVAVQYVHAVPPGSRAVSCSRLECPKFTKFRYSPGQSYSYRYEVNVASFVDGVSGTKESRIHLSSKVHFDVHTPCDWTLRVSDVTLQDSEPSDATRKSSVPGELAFKETLEKSDLPFTFHDGQIPNICPSVDEPAWSVNIKRGILSAFQNTMARFDVDGQSLESDVAGTCRTDYVFNGAELNAINVMKTRDISTCSNRYSLADSISGISYRFFGAGYDSIPLVNSTSWCIQTIAAHRITQSDCEEKHVVRPFSHEGSGAATTVRQLLVFLVDEPSENNEDVVVKDVKRTKSSLLYEHLKTKDSGVDSAVSFSTILQRLCQNTEEGVEIEAATDFGRLVKALKAKDYAALGELMTEAHTICRDGAAGRHLLNGLISAATSDAVAAMRDEVATGQVDADLIDRWITSLAFIPRPTDNHLSAALPLLDVASLSRQSSLSVSSMARKLCATNCGSQVHLLVGKLSKQLGNSCLTRSREEREEVVLALKSLANIGMAISGDHLDTVKDCFQEKDNPAKIRVAALKVFWSVPCHSRGDAAMKVLSDNSEDSEIRIAAYLGVMKCANYGTILSIKELLANEEINQVGSFIWTHLRNLATTSAPSKLEIQGLVLDQTLVDKFDTDARKFSRNYEKSILLDQYNAAASLESNIIFSQQSYLPRSASLNLTVDIFGQSVNLFEFDGRIEGFERYIESIFGPGGIYQQKDVSAVLEGLRPKRKVGVSKLNSGKLQMMDEQFDAGRRFPNEPEISLSMKLLGNEIGYGHWEGQQEVAQWFTQLNPVSKLHILMNQKEVQSSYATQYVDSSRIVPLSAGLPLSFVARGEVVADIRGSLQTDLKLIFSQGQGDIVWKIHPSAAVNFNGAMTVDAKAVKAGVTLEANLHSSVSTSGKFSLDGLKLFDLQIDLPQEKAEVISFKSDIILHHRKLPTTLTGITENRVDMSDCVRGFSQRYLGLQLCSQIAYPNASDVFAAPHFPLTGPAIFSMELVKADPTIKSYRFLHKIENNESLKTWTLTFRPEGSKEAKEVGLKAGIEYKESDSGNIGFHLMLPSNSYETKGTFKWKEETKTIEASFMRDAKEKLLEAKAGLTRSTCSKQSGALCYQPKLTLTVSNRKLVDLGGEIKLTEKKGTRNYELNFNSTLGSWNTVSKGYYLLDEKSHMSNLTIDYKSNPRDRPERIQIEVKMNKESSQGLHQFDLHLGVDPSAYPHRNFVGKWRLQRAQGHLDNVLTMNIGPMPRDIRNSLTIHQGFTYSIGPSSPQNLKFRSHFEMKLPAKALDVGLVIGHEQTDYKTDTLFLGRYAPGKEVQCGVFFHKKPGVRLQATAAFNLTLPSQPVVKLNGTIQEQSKSSYNVYLDGVWGHETDFRLNGSYDNQVKPTHSIQQLNIKLDGSTMNPAEFDCSFQTNQSAVLVQVKSNYGKDSVSVYLSQENPTKGEFKIATKVGYLQYLHTVDAYWKGELADSQKGTLDVHIDKVIDVRGDFSTDVATNGRRDISVDVQWDPNRNPQQKFSVKTSFEPSTLNPDDWTSAMILSYPGALIRGNLAALTQKNNRSLSGTIDLGSRKTINLLASTVSAGINLRTEVIVETPFNGWKLNRALFKSETKGLHHKTEVMAKWGPNGILEMGLEARAENKLESKLAQVSLGFKSSFDQLDNFKIATKAELQPKLLENTFTIQWGKNREIGIISNLEWSLDGQFMIKSDIGLTTPFPQVGQVKFEFYHNTEWDSAQLFETRASLTFDQEKYTALLKGENPGLNNRWEGSALLTTPHPGYSVIGITSQYTGDDKQPSFDLQVNWPGKEMGINLVVDIVTEGQHRANFQMKTPFEQLRNFSVDGSVSTSPDTSVLKFDLGTRWNAAEFVTFNTTWDVESLVDVDFFVHLKTSIPEHENYGTRLKFNLDLAEYPSASTVLTATFPSNQVGFSANGSMTQTDDGPTVDVTVTVEIGDHPNITIDISHETKGYLNFKTTTNLSTGKYSINAISYATTADDGHFTASVGCTTSLERLGEFEIRVRSLNKIIDEENRDMAYEAGVFWKEFNVENKMSGRLNYATTAEVADDLTEKTSTKFEGIFLSPWETVHRLSLKGKLINENSEMLPTLEAVFNNQSVSLGGNVDFISSSAGLVLTRKITGQSKPINIRMNSSWTLDGDMIKVEGTVATPWQGFSRIPWNVEVTAIDSEEDENDWQKRIRGEVRMSNSQFILLNAALQPSKWTADLATPFNLLKKINLTVDFEKMESSDSTTSVAAELRVNDDSMEITANFDWPQDNYLPVLAELQLNTPFEYEQVTFSWKSDQDPLMSAALLASWTKKNLPCNLKIAYNLSSNVDVDLKLEIDAGQRIDTWALRLNSAAKSLSITTPLNQLKNAEISAAKADKNYKVSVVLDTKPISGKLVANVVGNENGDLDVDANLQVLQFCQLDVKLKTDRYFSDAVIDASAVWDPTLVQWRTVSKLKRSGWKKYAWYTQLSTDSDEKWLFDFELDFANISSVYEHKIRYEAVHHQTLYNTYGSFHSDNEEYRGQLAVDWGAPKPLELTFKNKKIAKQLGNSLIEIVTPWTNETSLVIDTTIDARQQPVEFKISAEVADRVVIVATNIKYNSLNSMSAKTDVMTTYEWLPRASLMLNTHSDKESFNGSYVLDWSGDNLLDVYVFRQESDGASILDDKNVKGSVQVKTSWNKLPEAGVRYGRFFVTPTMIESGFTVNYNYTDVVNIVYKSNDKSSAGQETYQGQLEVKGTLLSGGVAFSRLFRYSGGQGGENLPTSLNRSVEIYELGKRPQFTLRAQLLEKETFTGKEHVIQLSSPLRTVQLRTHCHFPDGVFKHGTEFLWRPDAKIAYEVEIENKTTPTTTDYVMTTTLVTPVRSVGLTGTIRQTKRNLRAVGEIVWDLKRRDSVAKVTVTWENATKTRDVDVNRLKIGFSQGNLPQELAVVTEIRRSAAHPLNLRTEIQYSNEPQRKLLMDTLVTSRRGNYRYEMNMTHGATQLELRQVVAYERNNSTGRAQLIHLFSHSRSDSELMVLEHLLAFDPLEKRLDFSASSPMMTLRHQGQFKQTDNNTCHLTYEMQQDEETPKTGELKLSRHLPFAQAQYDPDNVGLFFKAGMEDKRQVILQVFNMDKEERVSLFDFALRLNHSRLVTSSTRWQTDWKSRLAAGIGRTRESLSQTADQWVSAFVLSSFSETVGSILIIADDVALVLDTALLNFMEEIEKLQEDVDKMKQNVIDGYNANAFFAKIAVDIGGAIVQDIPFGSYAQSLSAFIEKTGDRLLAPFTGRNDAFTTWLKRVAPYVTFLSDTVASWMGEQWKWPTEGSSKILAEISEIFHKIAQEFDRLQRNFWESLPDISVPFRALLRDSFDGVYQIFRPLVVRGFVAVESAVWNVVKEVLDFFYKHQEAFVGSSYFQKLSQLLDDVNQFYSDMQSADWPSRMRKYAAKAGQFLKEKYSDIDDYLAWMAKVQREFHTIYQAFLKENPELQKGAENWQKFVTFVQWSYNHLDINQKLSDLVAVIRERGAEIVSQTATDAQMRHSLQKTLFHFNPEFGSIELEQKLPFPWISLDEPPLFDQLPEIQSLKSFVSVFQSSNSTTNTVDKFLSYLPSQEQLTDFLPPFTSSAHLVGLQHFTTFDGRHFDFVGPCTYLLARDFLTRNFTLAVQYIGSRGKPYASVLQLVVDDAQWELDLTNHTVRVAGINRVLPTDERGTSAYYQDGKFIIESPSKGVHLQCVAAYDACTLTLSGWYNNKVGGLLGTMDNEPTTDLIRPNRVIDYDFTSLARSWDVSAKDDCKTVENLARKSIPSDDKLNEICGTFFQNKRSTLKKCFSLIDPTPYFNICLIKTRSHKGNAQDGCLAAAAYVSACAAKGVVLRMPPQCIRCQMDNESLAEGDETEIYADKLNRPSSDVVVLLDLKKCNEPDVVSRRFLPSLINSLEKELAIHKITKNRYSLIVFGGKTPYDAPRVRTLNGQEFVAAKDIENLLQNLPYGNGPSGVLDALRLASQLNFRPGVSKSFILLPCSSCESVHDYEITSQSLNEQDATLHVLTDAEFRFIKPNVSRQFLGLDATTGFTPKEVKGRLVGDADLRRQARLPKSLLGVCAPIALETNGTIFAVSRLREQRKNSPESKRAVNVWVKRVAATARPAECQKCACNLKNYYESVLDCRTCTPKATPIVDTAFLVHEAALQRPGKNNRNQSREN